MTEQEVLTERNRRFRLANNPARTLESAREFIDTVGFALVYPLRHPPVFPIATFMAAFLGTDVGVPFQHVAFADPRAKECLELMIRLLRGRHAFEVPFHEDSSLLASQEMFPYYYALVGEKTPKSPPKMSGMHKVSRLAVDVYQEIQRHGALSKSQLRGEYLERSGSITDAGMDRALQELWAILKITRVDYSPEEGSRWDLLARWAGDAVTRGSRISTPHALSAVISRYLDGVVAADEKEIEEFVASFAPRSRAIETMRALIAAGEIIPAAYAEGRTLLQVAQMAPARQQPAVTASRASEPRVKFRSRRNG